MRAVAGAVSRRGAVSLVVDPVLVATSGDALAAGEVVAALRAHLLPRALLLTPNIPEASTLLGESPPCASLQSVARSSPGCLRVLHRA